eukprot:118244_1
MLILYGKGVGFGDGIVYDIVDVYSLKSDTIVNWLKNNVMSDLNEYDNSIKFGNYLIDDEDNDGYDDNVNNKKQFKYENITEKIDQKLIIIAVVMGILAFCFGFGISYKRAKNKAE